MHVASPVGPGCPEVTYQRFSFHNHMGSFIFSSFLASYAFVSDNKCAQKKTSVQNAIS